VHRQLLTSPVARPLFPWGRAVWLGLTLLLAMPAAPRAETQVEVQGVGYPPIQSSSTSQALLLARRAATLDAYRNALRAAGQTPAPEENENLLELISGTVHGSSILAEEYLEDGGVRVRAMVKVAGAPALRRELGPGGLNASGPRAPKSVSLWQWQDIVRRHVRLDPIAPEASP